MILIVTIEHDLHALAVQDAVQKRGYEQCHLIECDRIAERYQLRARFNAQATAATIKLPTGVTVDIADAKVIWWRRVRADQKLDRLVGDDVYVRIINNDCRGALNGILQTCFRGIWISAPEATDRASDKIYQLAVARENGFRIPDTLISKSQVDVASFCEHHPGGVIVKPIVGAAGPLLPTQFVGDVSRFDEQSFDVSPAFFQEFIPGRQHIRLNCFGNRSFAATIETDELDWRPNLNVPIRPWPVPDSLHARTRATLDALGLAMGVVDLKMLPSGECVWFEVNPQGQFLFLEGLANMPLSNEFADYLLRTANSA